MRCWHLQRVSWQYRFLPAEERCILIPVQDQAACLVPVGIRRDHHRTLSATTDKAERDYGQTATVMTVLLMKCLPDFVNALVDDVQVRADALAVLEESSRR